jgi:hypothetical protein
MKVGQRRSPVNYKRFTIYLSGTAQNGCPWTAIAPSDDLMRNDFARETVCDLSGSPNYSVIEVLVADPILEQRKPLESSRA